MATATLPRDDARRLTWSAGLYAIKPAFQSSLDGLATRLVRWRVNPDHLTLAAVACSVAGGAVLVASTQAPALLWGMPALVAARLMLNALDGMVAVRRGVARPWGKVLNEACDRLADLAFLGPLLWLPGVSTRLMAAALCAALLVSYLGILSEAAGGPRLYGGVMGKADRMVWLSAASVLAAATGSMTPLAVLPVALLIGCGVTLAQRGQWAHAAL